MRLRGKTALITGGSRGIGKAIAIGMAREGANITVNYVQRYEEARNVVREIERMGGRAIVCAADITDLSSVERMINRPIKEFGRLDILVNNAGIIAWRKLAKVTREEWDRIIQISLTGVFNCTKSVMAPMMEEGFGIIILNASVYAFNGPVGSVAYSTAKSALIGFTKVLAKEAGPYGINVNALAPGYISTDMSKDILTVS